MENKFIKWTMNIVGIILGLICLSPFYIVIVNSFKSKKELFESTLALPSAFNLDNYTKAWEQLNFIKVLGNSLFITIVSVLLIIVFASMCAWSYYGGAEATAVCLSPGASAFCCWGGWIS